jgi:hypothetical protein
MVVVQTGPGQKLITLFEKYLKKKGLGHDSGDRAPVWEAKTQSSNPVLPPKKEYK